METEDKELYRIELVQGMVSVEFKVALGESVNIPGFFLDGMVRVEGRRCEKCRKELEGEERESKVVSIDFKKPLIMRLYKA